jgi:hypothetical protein
MYTFGQIRLLLQQFAPGVSLDIIDEKINSRYGLILDTMGWKGLESEGYLQTAAAYTTGTVDVTQGSAIVTGTGTAWASAITSMQFLLAGDTALYTVTYVSATSLTLDRPFEGNTANGAGYTLLQWIYALPADDKRLKTISSPVTGLALDEMTQEEFRQLVGFPVIADLAEKFVRVRISPTRQPGRCTTRSRSIHYPRKRKVTRCCTSRRPSASTARTRPIARYPS